MVQVLFSLFGNVNYIEGFPWVAMACGLPIRHGWCPAAPWLGGATGIDLAPVVLPKQQSMTKIALAKCPHFGAHRTQASHSKRHEPARIEASLIVRNPIN